MFFFNSLEIYSQVSNWQYASPGSLFLQIKSKVKYIFKCTKVLLKINWNMESFVSGCKLYGTDTLCVDIVKSRIRPLTLKLSCYYLLDPLSADIQLRNFDNAKTVVTYP